MAEATRSVDKNAVIAIVIEADINLTLNLTSPSVNVSIIDEKTSEVIFQANRSTLAGDQMKINIQHLTPGEYILKVESNEKRYSGLLLQ